MVPLYIFDLDGTLALIEHRRHFVENGRKQWDEFFKACVDDTVNVPVAQTYRALDQQGCEMWIFSGRGSIVYDETWKWLRKHNIKYSVLRMREDKDYTPDDVLKKQWLDGMLDADRGRLMAVFDDRDKVVKMWRDNGVACFQVAPGEF
jgi:hypothetical protein